MNLENLKSKIEKLEVLSDIYTDLGRHKYPTKSELDVAKLKMQLVKKEILLLSHLINNDINQNG